MASIAGYQLSYPRFGPLHIRSLLVGVVLLGIFAFARLSPTISSVSPSASAIAKTYDLLDDVLNRTPGVQKIHVINLPYRTDRRDAMSLAAYFTGIDVDYVDGIENVSRKTLPPQGIESNLSAGGLGCWRAHLNVLRGMVENNIQSALIIEDDTDWDVHIKQQMRTFAKSTQLLIQPFQGTTNASIDPSYPRPQANEEYVDISIVTYDQHAVTPATSSPYGNLDLWDLLWVGHCGKSLPITFDQNVPIGRVIVLEDETVPSMAHFDLQASDGDIMQNYNPLTRMVARAWGETCTSGYAVLLYELGIWKMAGYYDMELRSMCQGHQGRENAGVCLSPMPQYFNRYLPVGSMSSLSDISPDEQPGYVDRAFTPNVRRSTQVNFPRFIQGRTDWIDSFEWPRGLMLVFEVSGRRILVCNISPFMGSLGLSKKC